VDVSDLPKVVEEAGLLFRQASVRQDPQSMKRIIDWGHEQINVAYPEDPIRAPLNVIRRQFARWEWNRVIRTAGRDLRGTIASTMVRELEFEIQRRQSDILARDAEIRRQEAVTFDTRQRIQEFDLTEQIKLHNDKQRMQFGHDLHQQAEDAASRRRSEELVVATEQEVIRLINEAVIASAGSNATKEAMETVTTINEEVARIRASTVLNDDDKHLQIKNWLDAIPMLLQQARQRP